MEKYYVIYQSNGNLAINDISEWGNRDSAIAKWCDVYSLMLKDVSVSSASITILDSNLVPLQGYRAEVHKAAAEPAKSTKKSSKASDAE